MIRHCFSTYPNFLCEVSFVFFFVFRHKHDQNLFMLAKLIDLSLILCQNIVQIHTICSYALITMLLFQQHNELCHNCGHLRLSTYIHKCPTHFDILKRCALCQSGSHQRVPYHQPPFNTSVNPNTNVHPVIVIIFSNIWNYPHIFLADNELFQQSVRH